MQGRTQMRVCAQTLQLLDIVLDFLQQRKRTCIVTRLLKDADSVEADESIQEPSFDTLILHRTGMDIDAWGRSNGLPVLLRVLLVRH